MEMRVLNKNLNTCPLNPIALEYFPPGGFGGSQCKADIGEFKDHICGLVFDSLADGF